MTDASGQVFRWFIAFLGAATLVTGAAVTGSAPRASAASLLSLSVNTTADAPALNPASGVCTDSAGKCSLRAAIEVSNAQPAGTVSNVSVPKGTYALSLGPLAILKNTVNITGSGSSATIIENAKGRKGQLVTVAAKSTAVIADLEMTRGSAGAAGGGALIKFGHDHS